MRILYFSRDFTPHDHRFLSSLAKTDHDIYFLRLERGAHQLEDRNIPEGVVQVPWIGGREPYQWKKIFIFLRELKRVIREIRPDLIHAGPVQTCGFLTALTAFKPLVTMSWGSDLLKESEKNFFWKWITRFTLNRTTVLLGDCKAVQRKAESFGFLKENTVLFPWGIDLDIFYPGKNEEFLERRGWQQNFVILSLRSWEPIYGVDILAKAFIQAVREEPSLRLILLGSGSQSQTIHQIFDQAGLSEDVYWGGQVSQANLPGYYRAADLYVSASHSDGSSVSLMEALGSGLPVVVSNIPGNLEWIEDRKNGWLFEDGDVDDLKERLLDVYNNRNKLEPIKKSARELAETRADWNKNFKKLLGAYQIAQRLVKG